MTFVISVAISLVCLIRCVNGHGFVSSPRVRGTLGGLPRWGLPLKPLFPGIGERCTDHGSYWPSGDKRTWVEYGGIRSQEREAKYNWTPYEPTKKGFIFRTGVCGDEKQSSRGFPEAHLKGGRFYCPAHKPHIVETYEQGGVLDATVHMHAHHNGFMEFILCDVKYCEGGEISEDCLREGKHCQKLKRLYEPKCETRLDRTCAPIDPHYPTRWYMPCSPVAGKGLEIMKYIRFKLPNHVICDHCVLQWYWAAGNVCNPPGFAEFFKGPRGPKWNNCPGQAGARGGYARRFKTCGGKKFAEEYYSCSDIAILPKKTKNQRSKTRPSAKQRKEEFSKQKPQIDAYKSRSLPSKDHPSKKQPKRDAYKSTSSPKHAKKKHSFDIKSHHVGIISLDIIVESKNAKEVIYKVKNIGWRIQPRRKKPSKQQPKHPRRIQPNKQHRSKKQPRRKQPKRTKSSKQPISKKQPNKKQPSSKLQRRKNHPSKKQSKQPRSKKQPHLKESMQQQRTKHPSTKSSKGQRTKEDTSKKHPLKKKPSPKQPGKKPPIKHQARKEQPSTKQSMEQPSKIQPIKKQPSTNQSSTKEPSKKPPIKQQPRKQQPNKRKPSIKQPNMKERLRKEHSTKKQPNKEHSTKKLPNKEQPSKKQPSKEHPSKKQPKREAYESKSSPKHGTKAPIKMNRGDRKRRKHDTYKKKYTYVKSHHVGIISLNIIVDSKNAKEVIYKVKRIGWRSQETSRRRYAFDKATIAKKLRHHIYGALASAYGQKGAPEFTIRFK